VPVEESTHLYENTLAFINASGYADDDTNSGANRFGGIVVKEADNSSGADAAINVELCIDGQVLLTGAGFAATDVGAPVYAVDNYAIVKTATANSFVGRISEYVSATKVWVDIEAGRILPSTGTALTAVATTASTTTTPAGYTTTTQADAIVAQLNKVIATLKAAGFNP